MKVVILSNGELKFKEISNELEDFQKIVGGYIEVPFLSKEFTENGIDVIINEEGKFIDGLRPEIAILDGNTGGLLDVVYGNCIFASHNEEGETIELNKEQLEIIQEELRLEIMLNDSNKNKKYLVKTLIV